MFTIFSVGEDYQFDGAALSKVDDEPSNIRWSSHDHTGSIFRMEIRITIDSRSCFISNPHWAVVGWFAESQVAADFWQIGIIWKYEF